MDRSQAQTDRVFLRPQFSIHYRRAGRIRWASEAHPEYAAFFLLGGKLEYHSGATMGEMGEHTALLLDPGSTAGASGRQAEYLTLRLAPSYVLDCAIRTRLVSAAGSITFRAKLIEQDERLARLAGDLVDELKQSEPGQEMVVTALIEQLVVHLLRRHSNTRRSIELELSRAGLVDRRIRRAVELMHAHLGRDLPLEEVASAAHLSPFHFARLFKKLTGASPHAYLATLRVNHAQRLLAETDLTVTEVSTRVGYSSPSHFTKAFRQATGLTPRTFRAALVAR